MLHSVTRLFLKYNLCLRYASLRLNTAKNAAAERVNKFLFG